MKEPNSHHVVPAGCLPSRILTAARRNIQDGTGLCRQRDCQPAMDRFSRCLLLARRCGFCIGVAPCDSVSHRNSSCSSMTPPDCWPSKLASKWSTHYVAYSHRAIHRLTTTTASPLASAHPSSCPPVACHRGFARATAAEPPGRDTRWGPGIAEISMAVGAWLRKSTVCAHVGARTGHVACNTE